MAQELAKPEVVDFCSAKLVSIMGSSVAMFKKGIMAFTFMKPCRYF